MKLDVSHINQLIDLQIFLNDKTISIEQRIDKLITIACAITHSHAIVIFVEQKGEEGSYYEALHSKNKPEFVHAPEVYQSIKEIMQSDESTRTDGPNLPSENFFQHISLQTGAQPAFTYSIIPAQYSGFAAQLLFLWDASQQEYMHDNSIALQRFVFYFVTLYKQLDAERSAVKVFDAKKMQELSSTEPFQDYLGSSFETKKMLAIADRVAATDSSVLIYGESGVGKEVLAEHMYRNSLRMGRPFIKLNCAAIPEHLLESELFGHKKGSFTNALYDRKGKFLVADKGTLFLDEIGELSLSLQAKLLRVLQNKTIEPVGADEELTIDVRIMAATNKNLLELVQNNLFREDLYYRLHVIPIHIAPLRERKEEILELVEYFLTHQKYMLQKEELLGFSDNCKKRLQDYHWPGNVRELQNLVQRGIILAEGVFITTRDMFSDTVGDTQQQKRSIAQKDILESKLLTAYSSYTTLKDKLEAYKRLIIENELRYNEWNRSETAKQLGIQRTYLSRLIKELAIQKE